MRAPIPVCLGLLVVMGIGWLGCRSDLAPPPPADANADGRVAVFSAERAWKHLEALAAIGPRASGTEGAARARAYIRDELTSLGLEVVPRSLSVSFDSADVPDIEVVNLEATIAGDSPDLIVLAAPYDSAYRASFDNLGVNDGASGAALLLELARVLDAKPLPYTVRLYFLDGEAPLGRGDAEDAEVQLLGSMNAVNHLESTRELASIRLLVLMNRVSDADLRIARDRFSHRIYRDAIWRAAAALGYVEIFSPAAEFEAPVAGHRSFIDRGMRRAVAIVDPHFGADDAADLAESSEEDTLDRSSPGSLEVVGKVTLASLESISARLVKIDRFSESPVIVKPEPPAPAEPPPPDESSPPPEGESDESDAALSGGSTAGERLQEAAAP